MKNNQSGFIIAPAAMWIIGGLVTFIYLSFCPNPVSSVLGVGVKPNTIVQKQSHVETLVPLTNQQGAVITVNGVPQYKNVAVDTVNNSDKQPPTWMDHLLALPRVLLIAVVVLLVFFPATAMKLWVNLKAAWASHADLMNSTKQIVRSVDRGLDTITDPAAKKAFLNAMSTVQDSKVEDLVKELMKGT